jgi:hypothetical protein
MRYLKGVIVPFNFTDLQFSSEEEGDDMALSEGDPDPMPDDDSQQAAEAMVQLGNIGYYPPASSITNEQGSDGHIGRYGSF